MVAAKGTRRQQLGKQSKFASRCRTTTCSATIIEHRWHWRSTNLGIWDLDIHPSKDRLLTAGDDGCARVWAITMQDPAKADQDMDFVSCLSKPSISTGCNAARYNPLGDAIATGYDSSVVYLWRRTGHPGKELQGDAEFAQEHWVTFRALRLQPSNNTVAGLRWTPDGRGILAATSEGHTVIWDAVTGALKQSLVDHQFRCCGLALDPFGQELVTLGDDQRLCFYKAKPTKAFTLMRNQVSDLSRGILDQDKLRCVVRRAAWSPDGMWLVIPEAWCKIPRNRGQAVKRPLEEDDGILDDDEFEKAFIEPHGCFIYLRGRYDKPVTFLPAVKGLTPLVAQFSPVFYKASEGSSHTGWGTPGYRMLVAVACRERVKRQFTVLLYDNEHPAPLLEVRNLHLLPITSICWRNDGASVFFGSRDGFVSTIEFEKDVLGETVPEEDLPASLTAVKELKAAIHREARATSDEFKSQIRGQQAQRQQQQMPQQSAAAEKSEPPPSDAPAPAVHRVNVVSVKKKTAPTAPP
eukprot:Sspe_Gene.34799::Locus_16897_Transcript_1_1_Confidence_1.000_Length_1612::g.34799::m.34799/K10751/CHAF1B; chromatin assembly factor 1 subunit B